DPEHRVGARLLAQREQLVADLVDRLVPAYLLVLAVDELHRRLQAMVAMAVLAHGCALRAVRAEIDRRIEDRLLPCPHAVFDRGVDRATHRAMRADGALDLDFRRLFLYHFGLADQLRRQLTCERPSAYNETRALQKRPPIDRREPSS